MEKVHRKREDKGKGKVKRKEGHGGRKGDMGQGKRKKEKGHGTRYLAAGQLQKLN